MYGFAIAAFATESGFVFLDLIYIKSIAKATITPAAVKENKICNDTETEEAMLPQFPEWKVSPVKMADVDEKELTEKIIRELRAAFEKDIQVTLEKLKAARMECQGKKQSCPCISL